MISVIEKRPGRAAAIVLLLLLLAFAGRVGAQLIQLAAPTDLLPPFSSWQSGALPYSVLLASQSVIIGVSLFVIARLWNGSLRRRPRLGLACLAFGAIYFAFMLFRLIAGLTFLAGAPFFGAILPAIFHLVLATMLLITGRQLRRARDT
jgi:hypothetical protein